MGEVERCREQAPTSPGMGEVERRRERAPTNPVNLKLKRHTWKLHL